MSPFEIIGIIDMIKQFPLDYMHLLCLGTMKKLLLLWIRAMGKSEEALAKLAAFNDFYRKLAKSVPAEFSRHPRSLEEVAQWKATEFRLFLLYLGPVVLQHLLSKPQIIHFNVLNCAVRILCDPRECVRNNSYAQDLMIYFVDNMELLYGEETLIYNIHNLIHIPEDVLNHGPLDSFSCFPFENFLQKIKLMIKGGAQPLAQFIKRITERSIHLIPSDNSKTGYSYLNKRKNRLDDHQLPPGYTNFHQEIQFQDFLLTDKSPNNCCYLSNNSVVLVEHICCYKEIPVIVGRQFINTHSIADYPCDSRNLGIFDGRELSELQTWNIDEIDRKGFVVPYDADSVFKTYIMTHPDSLHQRNWRKRPRFLFRFSRQPIFHITDLHILLVNSQDMAAIQKHHNKQKRSMPSQASKGISQAKIIKIRNMYLPPNKFKAGTDTANILNNSGVQIIENSSVAPVQNANKKYVSQSQKRSAQKISTSSSLHQDQTILEYLEDNAETAEEQDDEYTYTEFLEDSSNDEVVGNDEVVENDEVRENDEVVENDEENNNQGDEVIVNREDRPEIHPHDAAVCCIQESILELDSDTETYSSLEAYKSLHKNNQPTSPSIFAHLKKRPKQSRLAFYSVKNSETVTENSAATLIVNNTIETSANINNNMDFNLDDTENKPLKKKRCSKRKDIPKQLNMRCKADRAKLKGQDCWECREYYKMLSLSEEEIQKRKNQCSRHRHKYERPNTPEGFWDPEFPETLGTY
ncbi:uncharacterized protein [Temnothorax longispinosus]|uniref:uncharacterized protein isoform X3 n=1 Tax=Temnothorax longispinosus TaxID=300112 RepID=UPI003A9A3D14